jgi:C-terminal processing protease CtpA/Prc
MLHNEIKKILKKYYILYDEKKWIKFNSDDNIKNDFYKIWKNEHGGYYTKNDIKDFNPPKYLPYYKNDFINIPEIATNDIKFQKKYVKTLNDILLKNDKEHLNLDFRNNFGGKPEIMVAGLLPLFNMSKRKVLTYITTKTKRIIDIIKNNNCITCISNNKSSICGTKLKMNKIKKISIHMNKYTISSGEQSIIALLSLSDIIDIELIGDNSGGYTTCNKYIELSNGDGIEIPVGYMTDIYFNIYKKGIIN